MSRDRGESKPDGWEGKNGLASLATGEFLKKVRTYLDAFIAVQQPVINIAEVFYKGKAPDYDHCESAVRTLCFMHEPIQLLLRSLDGFAPVIACCYQLIAALDSLNEQVQAASDQICAFKITCHSASLISVRQHQEIRRRFTIVIKKSEEVIHLTHVLLDQVRLEELRSSRSFSLEKNRMQNRTNLDEEYTREPIEESRIIYFNSELRKRVMSLNYLDRFD